MKTKFYALGLLSLLVLAGCVNYEEQGTPLQNSYNPQMNATTQTDNSTNLTVVAPLPFVSDVFLIHNNNLTFYFLDKEKPLVAVITPDNHLIIVDTGSAERSLENINAVRNVGFLKADALIITSLNHYRIEGLPYILERLKPNGSYYSGIGNDAEETYRLIKNSFGTFERISGDKMLFYDKTLIKMFVPYDDGLGLRSENEQNSIVLKISYGTFSLLIGSDCIGECEDRITIDSDLSADVLVLPLRGKCDGFKETSSYFIKNVGAELNVGSGICGKVAEKVKMLGGETHELADNYFVITTDGTSYATYEVKR